MTSEPTARPKIDRAVAKESTKETVSSKSFMAERLNQFDSIMQGCRELFEEKNSQYKDSISRTGVLGSVVAIAGLSARLEGLVLSDPNAAKDNEEAIVDVVKDIINYGVITGIMIMDDNWKP